MPRNEIKGDKTINSKEKVDQGQFILLNVVNGRAQATVCVGLALM